MFSVPVTAPAAAVALTFALVVTTVAAPPLAVAMAVVVILVVLLAVDRGLIGCQDRSGLLRQLSQQFERVQPGIVPVTPDGFHGIGPDRAEFPQIEGGSG